MSHAFDAAIVAFRQALDTEERRVKDIAGDVVAAETRLRALKQTDAELTAAVEKVKNELVAAARRRDGGQAGSGGYSLEAQVRATEAIEKAVGDAISRPRRRVQRNRRLSRA